MRENNRISKEINVNGDQYDTSIHVF